MTVYMIIEAKEVWDPKSYGDYCRQVPDCVQRYGGKYLAKDMAPQKVAGDWSPSKIVIIEFPSKERFQAWWSSAEYAKLKPLREGAAKVDAIIVSGI